MSNPWTPIAPDASPWVATPNAPEWWTDSSTLTFEGVGDINFDSNPDEAVQFTGHVSVVNPWTPVID